MKPKKQLQAEAIARQTASDKLTPQERIAKLDKKLGKGKGAAKERARLAKLAK